MSSWATFGAPFRVVFQVKKAIDIVSLVAPQVDGVGPDPPHRGIRQAPPHQRLRRVADHLDVPRGEAHDGAVPQQLAVGGEGGSSYQRGATNTQVVHWLIIILKHFYTK